LAADRLVVDCIEQCVQWASGRAGAHSDEHLTSDGGASPIFVDFIRRICLLRANSRRLCEHQREGEHNKPDRSA
jgi:hypothetical protein